MSRFSYRARTDTGQIVQGELSASTAERAAELLKGNNLQALQVEPLSTDDSFWSRSLSVERVRTKDLIIFARQLSTMIAAGVPIVQSLQAIEPQIGHQYFQKVIRNLVRGIQGGDSFSLSLARYPTVFSPFFLGLARTGESTGTLTEALRSLADYLEQDYIFRRKVIASLTYPALILITMVIVTIIIFSFVLPQIVELFNDAKVTLPLPTRIIFAVVHFWSSYWYVLLLVAIAGGVMFRFWSRTPEGRYAVSSMVLRLPIIRSIFQKVYLARFTSMLHILFNSDVPILESLKLVENAMSNRVYQRILSETRAAVKDGAPISSVWKNEPFIPPLLTSLVSVGEKSGKIETAFSEANRFFRREVDDVLSTITVLLEPLVVVILGIGVAIIVASVFLPIYNLVLTV